MESTKVSDLRMKVWSIDGRNGGKPERAAKQNRNHRSVTTHLRISDEGTELQEMRKSLTRDTVSPIRIVKEERDTGEEPENGGGDERDTWEEPENGEGDKSGRSDDTEERGDNSLRTLGEEGEEDGDEGEDCESAMEEDDEEVCVKEEEDMWGSVGGGVGEESNTMDSGDETEYDNEDACGETVMRGLADDISSEHVCAVCHRSFQNSSTLMTHLRSHTGEKPFSCDACERTFCHEKALRKHTLREHNVGDALQCDVCLKLFYCVRTLQRHSRVHSGAKPYACTECAMCFSQECDLVKHSRKHSGEKPYKCDVEGCNKVFPSSSNLHAHIRGTHLDERRHPCHACGKKFLLATHLRAHLRTHSSERLHHCANCDKSFREAGSLKRHMTTHTGERPYSCSECGKGFPIANNLKKHMRTHTGEKPYACQVCGKSFSSGSNLKTHLKSHTGEKHHICDTCEKRFTLASHLKAHMRTHDKSHVFTCSVCGRSFTALPSLRRHLALHDASAVQPPPEEDEQQKNGIHLEGYDIRFTGKGHSGAEGHSGSESHSGSEGHSGAGPEHHSESSPFSNIIVKSSAYELYPSTIIASSVIRDTFSISTQGSDVQTVSDVKSEVHQHYPSLPSPSVIKLNTESCTGSPLSCSLQSSVVYHTDTVYPSLPASITFGCGSSTLAGGSATPLRVTCTPLSSGSRPTIKHLSSEAAQDGAAALTSVLQSGGLSTTCSLKPYQCSSCDRSFMTEEVLNFHVMSHSTEHQHTCRECSTTFMEENSLKRHMKIHQL